MGVSISRLEWPVTAEEEGAEEQKEEQARVESDGDGFTACLLVGLCRCP